MTSERVELLKCVSLFAESSDDMILDVNDLLVEASFTSGQTIFEKGQLGDCMYIVAEGRVRIHDGDRTLNYLGKREFFGEMGVLDPNPRSASATADQPTVLLRLDQEALFALMNHHPGVVRGLIHVLVQRLRARTRDMADDYRYIQQFSKVIAAAVAVEEGRYEPELLDDVAARDDQLGQLARLFQRMTREVYQREQSLKRQVEELRIEIDHARQAAHVSQITESDYFQQLQSRAKQLRRMKPDA